MQGICDHNMVLLNVVAKWQGSTHDSFILQSSGIPDQFESGTFGTGWLLGDSGYSLKEWLLTPMAEPSTPQHRNYNVIHRKTRCLIERTFGLLKSRWRILDHTGGSLLLHSSKSVQYNHDLLRLTRDYTGVTMSC